MNRGAAAVCCMMVLALAACESDQASTTTTVRPNVLLIVADDLGWSDLGAYGSEIPTPALDRLAADGLMLTSFHTAPSCSPSRAMLLTGQDNHSVGLGSMAELLADNQRGQPGYEGFLDPAAPTLAEHLSAAGYHSYMVGKWHLGDGPGQRPSQRGFERTFALMDAAGSHFSNRGFMPMKPTATYMSDGRPVELPDGFFSSDSYTEKLIEFIDQNAGDGRPFFAYAAYTAPHYPLHAPEEWMARFTGRYDSGWDELRLRRWNRMKSLGLIPAGALFPPRNEMVPEWEALPTKGQAAQARRMEVYAAMIANLDWNISRLLSHLEQIGIRDNTMVIFISDNGAEGVDYTMMPGFSNWFEENFDNRTDNVGREGSYAFLGPGWAQVSNTPFRLFKGLVAEGGIRVPAIISAPGHAGKSMRSGAFATVRDILPTVLELSDAGIGSGGGSATVGSRSLASLLTLPSTGVHSEDDAMGWELLGQRALFRGDWKAESLRPPWGDTKWQLFNLDSDPYELDPVQDQFPEVLQKLVELYDDYATSHGVIAPPDGTQKYPLLPPINSWSAE